MERVAVINIDDVISNDICYELDRISFAKDSEIFKEMKRLLETCPVRILTGTSQRIQILYRIHKSSEVYNKLEPLKEFSDDSLILERKRKERILVICISIKDGLTSIELERFLKRKKMRN
ncbi:hypothetical protein FACS1894113_2660 [Alphaproteobacteria bacterium]|nr:hypothetical protein FACS1894113_2660 [Alphaproteobacteria bacterium]